jgi:hypothetical protein
MPVFLVNPDFLVQACIYTHLVCISLFKPTYTGVEIRCRPILRDHHFLGKDDHVLTDGSPSDDLIFAPIMKKDH